MIRKLQIKFVCVIMGALVLVFAVIFTTLNIFMQTSSRRQTDQLLDLIAQQEDFSFRMPDDRLPGNEPPGEMVQPPGQNPQEVPIGQFFYVKLDTGREILETRLDMMFDFTEEAAEEYVDSVLQRGNDRGVIGNMQYLVVDKDYGKIIVFAEKSVETQMLQQLLQVSLWVVGITCVVLFGAAVLFARWAVKPVKQTLDKQRRFVSDASHELKTPLTVISANADVLAREIGENRWVSNIQSQSERMGSLIQDLLTLASAEEKDAQIVMSTFDLSQAVLQTTLEFEEYAFEAKKSLAYEIDEGIHYLGHAQKIKQAVAILIDNAVKHSDVQGEIKVSLKKESGKTRITVYNSGEGLDNAEQEKIFDRFYRTDLSRSRETGGYGLGLSIAKSIVDAHKGKISVSSQKGKGTAFTIVLQY